MYRHIMKIVKMGEDEVWVIGNEKWSVEREELFNRTCGGRGEVGQYERDTVVSELLGE